MDIYPSTLSTCRMCTPCIIHHDMFETTRLYEQFVLKVAYLSDMTENVIKWHRKWPPPAIHGEKCDIKKEIN